VEHLLNKLTARFSELLRTQLNSGAVWFFLANALPSFTAVALGPFILKKVGLGEYAVLGLTTYFFNLVGSYSDFSGYTHLLAVYSKRTSGRHSDFGNALILKASLLAFFFCVLEFFSLWHPRKDDLYLLLAISMLALALPSANMEWFFVARKRYFQIFLARLSVVSFQLLLTMIWFFSGRRSSFFIPLITLASGAAGSLCLLMALGPKQILNGMIIVRQISFRGMRGLVIRLFPMAAAMLVTPYFLAYALPWYSLTSPDKRLLGAFSIAYRLIMGVSALMVPLVIFSIPQRASSNKVISFRNTFMASLLAIIFFWTAGIPVLRLYFHISKVDPVLFSYSLRIFSILMLGVFFLCLRTPYVGRLVVSGRYRDYFLILLVSCTPVLAFSLIGGKKIPSETIAWLACLPDFLATVGFVGYNRILLRIRSFRSTTAPV